MTLQGVAKVKREETGSARTGRAWSLAVAGIFVSLALAAGPAVASDGAGDYTAREFPLSCPTSLDEPAAKTSSFSGGYEHSHKYIQVVIEDDVASLSTVSVCTYDADRQHVGYGKSDGSVVMGGSTPHRYFLGWVEPVEVETNEGTLTFASTGTYTYAGFD